MEQSKIEHYTEDEFKRITEEVLFELSDNAEEIRKKKILKDLKEAEERIFNAKKAVNKLIVERKQQKKLFKWDDNNEEKNQVC